MKQGIVCERCHEMMRFYKVESFIANRFDCLEKAWEKQLEVLCFGVFKLFERKFLKDLLEFCKSFKQKAFLDSLHFV